MNIQEISPKKKETYHYHIAYAQWCSMVQLRHGCVLNLESESLRLVAGSAFCNSSAFGAEAKGG